MSQNHYAMEQNPVSQTVRGAFLRVVLTVLIPVFWVSLTLLYVAFWAPSFSFFQDVVLVIVSLLAMVGAIVVMWIAFGIRLYHRWID
ncbi:MAG: hypothetical protein L3K10_05145 [Thermoplasmata archaeon]|nr:hypothetical protein [Thermoplasmata archaeon]